MKASLDPDVHIMNSLNHENSPAAEALKKKRPRQALDLVTSSDSSASAFFYSGIIPVSNKVKTQEKEGKGIRNVIPRSTWICYCLALVRLVISNPVYHRQVITGFVDKTPRHSVSLDRVEFIYKFTSL